MSKPLKRIKWKATKCPKGCGATWNHWVHVHRNGACCRVYWTHAGAWKKAPIDNKPCATFRVRQNPESKEWEKHPTNPAWKDTWGVKRCC